MLILFEFLVHGLECMTLMTKRRGSQGDEVVVDEGESSGRRREFDNNLRDREKFNVRGRERNRDI